MNLTGKIRLLPETEQLILLDMLAQRHPALVLEILGRMQAILSGTDAPPIAGRCPICLAAVAVDGSHISALSGAHIPAQPAEVTG